MVDSKESVDIATGEVSRDAALVSADGAWVPGSGDPRELGQIRLLPATTGAIENSLHHVKRPQLG